METTLSGGPLESLGRALVARRGGAAAPQPGFLLIDPAGSRAGVVLDAIEDAATEVGSVAVAGAWREGLLRPFGGLLELVDGLFEEMLARQSGLLARYSLTLANLLPARRRVGPLSGAHELRSGLADFILDGDRLGLKDYYWKRNVRPLIVADLIHFVLEAAAALADETGEPALLRLEGLDLADSATRETVKLLNRYGARLPVLLCATSRSVLEGMEEWTVLRLEEHGGSPESGAGWAPEQRELVAAAAVLALPFELSAWLALLPKGRREAAAGAAGDLVRRRVFRRLGENRFTFHSMATRAAACEGLTPERWRGLHVAALAVEAADPFAATWHSVCAGLPAAVAASTLPALRRAWALSDYEAATELARLHLSSAEEGGRLDADVLLALLAYEAGLHEETERRLQRVCESGGTGGIDRTTLLRLLGYNAIFGLGEFDRGRGILETVLASYEAEGREQEAGFVRNSIAFSLARVGRLDDAIQAENLALNLLESSDQPGGFLFSVLQLNLGRLYRNLGLSDQALDLFRRSMEAQGAEFSPYMLLIFHVSLAQLHESRENFAAAMAACHHCFDLALDLELENASYPVLNLLSRPVGPLLAGLTTRGDEVFFYLYLNLALLSGRLGLHARKTAYLEGMKRHWSFLGGEVWERVGTVLHAAQDLRREPSEEDQASRAFADGLAAASARFAGLVQEEGREAELIEAAAKALAEGQTLAWVRPRSVGNGAGVVDSLVLYDPRRPGAARRVSAEFGAYTAPGARMLFTLPEALGLFSRGAEPLPLILQEATVGSGNVETLAGVVPVRVRLQVLSPEFDGSLFEVLKAFHERTGLGVLAVAPFHLRSADLAVTPEKALAAFLVSSLDGLILGDRLLRKRHGAEAEQNLLPFRPRLSRRVSMAEDGKGSLLLLMRVWFYQSCLRLSGEVRPILDFCDGRRSVAEVVGSLAARYPAEADWERRVCGFLRDLRRHGVLCFDEPAAVPAWREAGA